MADVTTSTLASACRCSSSSRDDETIASTSGSDLTGQNGELSARNRRRHSFFLPRRRSLANSVMDGEDGLLLRVDLFLTELERRLDFIESYGDLSMDSSISRAFSTLQAVRTRCSEASGEVIGKGRDRLHVMVETLEARYNDTLEAAESLNEKARMAIDVLETMLSEFEVKAYKLREQGLAGAATLAVERAKGVVDEGLERARRAALSLEDHIAQAISMAKEKRLIRYDDLPMPWRNNPHIVKGYRFSETKMQCVRSAFDFHNESFNIWSHAIGLVLVLAAAFYFYPTSTNFSQSSYTDIFVAAVFFVMACLTLVCSTIWHTMNAVADVNAISIFACVDYTGISLLIAASIMTTEYTAFYCDPVSRWTYMCLTAALGTGGVVLPWHPRFNRADMAWARVAFYVGLALTGFAPIVQLWFTHGSEFVRNFYSPITKSILVYFTGAVVYGSKIPERWYPGVFDYIGGSHNFWHLAVLGGILFHYTAMQQFFANAFLRAEGGCPAY